jgi:hypothetical protein
MLSEPWTGNDPGHNDRTHERWLRGVNRQTYAYAKVSVNGPNFYDKGPVFDAARWVQQIKPSRSGPDTVQAWKHFPGIKNRIENNTRSGTYTTSAIRWTAGSRRGLGDGYLQLQAEAAGALALVPAVTAVNLNGRTVPVEALLQQPVGWEGPVLEAPLPLGLPVLHQGDRCPHLTEKQHQVGLQGAQSGQVRRQIGHHSSLPKNRT